MKILLKRIIMGREDIDWIYLAENRYRQWALVSKVSVSMKFG
jgi:hypothetical protein